jgi:hypothetical protein
LKPGAEVKKGSAPDEAITGAPARYGWRACPYAAALETICNPAVAGRPGFSFIDDAWRGLAA